MIAAVYARKSTEQSSMNAEEKSVTRQIQHAKNYAHAKGWTVPDDLIFVNDRDQRRGIFKTPRFLAPHEQPEAQGTLSGPDHERRSRLGREQIQTRMPCSKLRMREPRSGTT